MRRDPAAIIAAAGLACYLACAAWRGLGWLIVHI